VLDILLFGEILESGGYGLLSPSAIEPKNLRGIALPIDIYRYEKRRSPMKATSPEIVEGYFRLYHSVHFAPLHL
jgi:hypothetical protein